jgi:hypothetical protein
MAPTPRHTTRTGHRLSLLLGALVLCTGIGAFLLASGPQGPFGAASETAVVPAIVGEPVTGDGTNTKLMSISAAPGVVGAPASACSLANAAGCAGEPWDGAYDVDDLPAWRWRSIELDVDTSGGFMGITGGFKSFPAMIAEFFYLLAQWLWLIVLGVMKLGFDSKVLITAGTQSINAGAAFMADKMLYFAVPIAGIVAWRFVKEFVKLKTGLITGAFRSFTIFAVSFGMTYMVVDRSSYAVTNHKGDRDAQLEVAGTIPWMAREILDIVDNFTGPITDPVLKINVNADQEGLDEQIAGSAGKTPEDGDLTQRSTGAASTTVGKATCQNYVEAIYGAYASGPSPEKTLIVVSRLWESTLYESWKGGAFGSPVTYVSSEGPYASDIPERVMCHFAESETGTSAEEQQRIAHVAYGAGIPAYSDLSNVPAVFGPFDATNNKEERKAMTAWAACRLDGTTWSGQIEFDGAWADSGTENVYDSLCAGVMTTNASMDGKFYVFSGDVKEATARGDTVHREQLRAAREYGTSYGGGSPGTRIMGGLISLLVAAAFIVTFGFLGLGLLVAMMLAVVFLALALPASLMLAAIGRTKQAQPLFKMTVLSLLSHGLLTVILSLIIIISGVFRALISNLTPGGFIGALTSGLAPVAAFFAVRKVLKSLGMADILTPSGALGFAGAAALKAGGGELALSGKNMAAGKALSKLPGIGRKLEKMDRFAPNWKNWTESGRKKRRSDVKKEDGAETARRQQRIKDRGPNPGRIGRLRNRIDRARLPGTTRAHLKDVVDRTGVGNALGAAGRMGGKGGGALTAAALAGPLGFVALGAGGVAMLARRHHGRGPGEAIDPEDAVEGLYNKASLRRGREVGEEREETVRGSQNLIDTSIAETEARMRNYNPAGLDDAAIREAAERDGVRAVAARMLEAFAIEATESAALRTEAERDGLRIAAGKAEGYPAQMMLTTAGGNILPMPYDLTRKRRELDDEQLGHFVHWLPKEDRERRTITETVDGHTSSRTESESEYCARLLATGVARGVARPDGTSVDVLALKGIDVSTKEGRKIVADWRKGEPNEILDTLKIVEVDPRLEKQLVTSSVAVAREQEKTVYLREVNANLENFRNQETAKEDRAEAWKRAEPGGHSEKSKEVGELAGATAQLLVAVNAARELFEKAKTGGDSRALNAAAQRMSLTMQKLEENQAQLVEGLGNSMAENFEKMIVAQQDRDANFAQDFEKVFEDGVVKIEGAVNSLRRSVDAFLGGTLSLQSTLTNLTGIVDAERRDSRTANAEIQAALAGLEAKMTSPNGRPGVVWSTQNSRDVAESSGATGLPAEDGKSGRRPRKKER